MTNRLARWAAFILEAVFLLMLYSATLLAPIPFGIVRIGSMVVLTALSFTFAYLATSPVESQEVRSVPLLRRAIARLPLAVWALVLLIILLELGRGLLMVNLVRTK